MSDAPESTIKLAEAVRASIADPAGCLEARWFEDSPKNYRDEVIPKQHAREIIGYAIEEALNLAPEPWQPAPGDVVRPTWDKKGFIRCVIVAKDEITTGDWWIAQNLESGLATNMARAQMVPITEELEDNC